MPTQKISKLLAASSELKALSGKTRRLMELQQVYVESAPEPLVQASRVKNYRAGTLFLLAGNTAVAAKLRQLAPRILANIQKQESEITAIRVDVQVTEPQHERESNREKKGLSPETIDNFRKLSERMPDSMLKSALAELVRRRSR